MNSKVQTRMIPKTGVKRKISEISSEISAFTIRNDKEYKITGLLKISKDIGLWIGICHICAGWQFGCERRCIKGHEEETCWKGSNITNDPERIPGRDLIRLIRNTSSLSEDYIKQCINCKEFFLGKNFLLF